MPESVPHPRRDPRHARQRGGVLDARPISAVILAGGQGTRLRPLTLTRPKPVVPLLNVPFLAYQLALLREHGVRDVVLSCSYMVDEVKRTMGDGSRYGVRLAYAVEVEPLGTGGGVRNAAGLVDGLVVVLNGDVLTDIDLGAMLRFHRDRGSAATIYLTRVPDPRAYGLVELGDGGRVARFLEKPDPALITTDTINAGVYALDRALIDRIPTGRAVSIEREFFPALLQDGISFHGWVAENYWLDIGSPAKYLQGQLDLLAGRFSSHAAPPVTAPAEAHAGTEMDDAARVDVPAVLGARCRIAARARVGPGAVLGEGCVVGEAAVVERTVLWDDVSVGPGAHLADCVVGAGARIGARARVDSGAVVESGGVVPDDARLSA